MSPPGNFTFDAAVAIYRTDLPLLSSHLCEVNARSLGFSGCRIHNRTGFAAPAIQRTSVRTGSAEPIRKHPMSFLNRAEQPRRQLGPYHWRNQEDPELRCVPGNNGGPKLPRRIQTAPALGAERRDSEPYQTADQPGHARRKPRDRQEISDQEDDHCHAHALGNKQRRCRPKRKGLEDRIRYRRTCGDWTPKPSGRQHTQHRP